MRAPHDGVLTDAMFDLDLPFFAPPWRRQAVLLVCFGWAAFEALNAAFGWAIVFAGLGGIAWWQFRKIDWSKYEDGS